MAADSATAAAALFGEENDENAALDASRVGSVERMDEADERENDGKEEYEDNSGWRLVGQRKPKKQMPETSLGKSKAGKRGRILHSTRKASERQHREGPFGVLPEAPARREKPLKVQEQSQIAITFAPEVRGTSKLRCRCISTGELGRHGQGDARGG
ncbi:hypothetical protein HPB50_025164 [Hyalomma asiaticum]|uniref:Uncharacterized protein n=1 Tax=Hyalomma asiaticum TaxID=266040 RepID=A0ACB7TT35_HYAAI|nr:hypothetical protein HPB50_025164 [Hyalomma asiaticum]